MSRPQYRIRQRAIGPSPWGHLMDHLRAAAGFALATWCAVGSAMLLGAKLPPGMHIVAIAAAAAGGAVFAFRR
jgi:hypothetical protein